MLKILKTTSVEDDLSECLKDYLGKHEWNSLQADPIKTIKLNRPKKNNQTLTSRHDLAFLFLEHQDQHFIKTLNLDTCGDVRVFLKIMIKAGCFPEDETQIVKKLKDFRNQLAHEDLFTREFMKTVFDDMTSLLESIETNHRLDTSMYQRKLMQLRKFGAQQYLKKNKKTSFRH